MIESTVPFHYLGEVDPIPTVIPDPVEYRTAGHVGCTALWITFGLMVLTTAIFVAMSWRIPVSKRVYHVITTLITVVAALSYFAMASGHGVSMRCERKTDHHDHLPDTHHLVCREVYWARYIDWSLTTPLLLLDLCLLAGVDGAHTLMAIAADVIMILSGLFAAFGRKRTAQKWGWFAIACVSYLVVIWHVAVHGSATVRSRGEKVTRLFSGLASFTLILWTAYPIVWAIGSGAHKISPDTEIVIYAVLDVLAKGFFGFWLLTSQRKIPEANVELNGYWSHGLASEGRIRIGDDDGA